MAVGQKQVSYCVELDQLLALVVGLVKDVKGGKSPLEAAYASIPALIQALGGLDQVSGEAQDHEALDDTVLLRAAELKRLLLPSLP